MQDVPKIVLRRLPEVAAGEVHPDADVLTAFAEQSLGETERTRVMEHLARCGDCREVVEIALLPDEAVAVGASTSPTGRPWVSWPVLRWGVVVAGVMLVTSAGVLQYRHSRQQPAALVSKLMPQERAAETNAQNPLPDSSASKQTLLPRSETGKQVEKKNSPFPAPNPLPSIQSSSPASVIASRVSGANSARASAGSDRGIAGSVPSTGPGTGQAPGAPPRETVLFAPAARNATGATALKQTPASGAGSTQLSSETVEAQVDAHAQNQSAGRVESQLNLPVPGRSAADADVVKAKDLAAAQAASTPGPATALPASNAATPTLVRASPRWAISASGGLQRSFDAGTTWEDLNLSQAPLGGLLQKQNDFEYKAEANKTKKKTQANPPLVFRAVAAIDPEVWAGGSGAMLYHSFDSGAHWVRVLPLEAGAVLTGDITGVEFSERQHGRIVTSTGEVWATADAGRTWHRQE